MRAVHDESSPAFCQNTIFRLLDYRFKYQASIRPAQKGSINLLIQQTDSNTIGAREVIIPAREV